MWPKCIIEAGRPPDIFASKIMGAFRSDASETNLTADFPGAQSLFLCIAVFPLAVENRTEPCRSKAIVTFNRNPS